MITHGIDDELSSVAFTIANGGMTAGLKVSVFLTSAGVDLARKRAIDTTQVERSIGICFMGYPPECGNHYMLWFVRVDESRKPGV